MTSVRYGRSTAVTSVSLEVYSCDVGNMHNQQVVVRLSLQAYMYWVRNDHCRVEVIMAYTGFIWAYLHHRIKIREYGRTRYWQRNSAKILPRINCIVVALSQTETS